MPDGGVSGGPMAYDYEFLLRVRAPRPVVFEKLLRIEHLARWFCGWCRIEPKVGGRFTFGGETCLVLPEGRGWETTIDEGETLRRFAFTWPIHGTPTRVSYELEDADPEWTILKALHAGVPMKDSTCGSMQDAWHMVLGNLKSISEGRSDGVRPDHAPVEERAVRLSALIEVPPDKIFAALLDPSQLDHWANGGVPTGKARVEPRPGGAFAPGWDDGPDRILELLANQRLVIGWPHDAGDLQIDLSLEPKASGTAVYLVSTGYGEGQERAVLDHRGRWSALLVCLKNFLEGGDAGFANAFDGQVREQKA